MTRTKGPVIIDLDENVQTPDPFENPLPDQTPPPPAMVRASSGSVFVGWFWKLLAAVVGFTISVAVWDFTIALYARNVVFGWIFTALLVALGLGVLKFLWTEFSALRRLARMDRLQEATQLAWNSDDITLAKSTAKDIANLYKGRSEMRGLVKDVETAASDSLDAKGVLAKTEATLLSSLDAAAVREIERASRTVATVTTLVPLAFADVTAALVANVRMIRNIAEIYGGRGGTLGSWRLMRSVMTHLVATGAVAIGDDWFGSVLGSSVFSKLSRRFGEGMVNGALTARVGKAAVEVCRPMPFETLEKPSVSRIVKNAYTGLFDKDS